MTGIAPRWSIVKRTCLDKLAGAKIPQIYRAIAHIYGRAMYKEKGRARKFVIKCNLSGSTNLYAIVVTIQRFMPSSTGL